VCFSYTVGSQFESFCRPIFRAFFPPLEKEVLELTRGKDKHTESLVTISLYNITVYLHIL
jgi:hypothetical protein